ncbi:hypothetical protein GIB67_034422 [Kingdonia uniflora]|uniref:Uncharacterized protein n=1 Tax=Kingdonia uniflora TaxID=39325 RepID=A0A7J7PB47_9MAGN|nr:hypothetical protein GIB67_034422 [Kingdonia uniflora]
MCFRDLSSNVLTGDLPESFSSLTSVNNIYLQSNQFTGTIVVLKNFPLQNLNVANNRFSGWIPGNLKKINNLQTDGNSWTTRPAPPPPPFTPLPGRPVQTNNLLPIATHLGPIEGVRKSILKISGLCKIKGNILFRKVIPCSHRLLQDCSM